MAEETNQGNIEDVILSIGLPKRVDKTKESIRRYFPEAAIREVYNEDDFFEEIKKKTPNLIVSDGYTRSKDSETDETDNYYLDCRIEKEAIKAGIPYVCSRFMGLVPNLFLGYKLRSMKK